MAKPKPAHRTDMPALEAVQALLLEQLTIVRAEEDGVRRDLHIEHLHQLRVALRRTRSALSMLREIFPKELGKRYRKDLRWIGQINGPVRDLDVWLVKLDGYADQLPEGTDLGPLWSHLRKRRAKAFAAMIEQMDRKRYDRILAGWEGFLSEPCVGKDRPSAADLPIREVAARHIANLYDEVVRDGSAITDETPDEAVHDLRIQVKKLRYLMAFFGDLFDEAAVAKLRKPHKALQNCLGDFNDLCVQHDSLGAMAEELVASGKGKPSTFLAIGHLQGRIAGWKDTERARFAERFAPFASEESRAAYHALFGPPRPL